MLRPQDTLRNIQCLAVQLFCLGVAALYHKIPAQTGHRQEGVWIPRPEYPPADVDGPREQ